MPRRRHLMKRITLKGLETSGATIAEVWRYLYKNGAKRRFELEESISDVGRVDQHLKRLVKAGFVERIGSSRCLVFRAVHGKDEVKVDTTSQVQEIRSRLGEMHKVTRKAIETGLAVHAFEALRMIDKELEEIRGLMLVKHVGKLRKQTDAEG